MPSWKLATPLAFQQQLWSLEAFHRLTMLQKSLHLSGIAKINCITFTYHEWLPCGQPLQPTGFFLGYHIKSTTRNFLHLCGAVCQKMITIFKLNFSHSKKNRLFFCQQAKFIPSGKVCVVKCLVRHFKACAQYPMSL